MLSRLLLSDDSNGFEVCAWDKKSNGSLHPTLARARSVFRKNLLAMFFDHYKLPGPWYWVKYAVYYFFFTVVKVTFYPWTLGRVYADTARLTSEIVGVQLLLNWFFSLLQEILRLFNVHTKHGEPADNDGPHTLNNNTIVSIK